jgi:UDP-N-acetylglucosamine 2-epimerase (non-hydrolysing)
MVKMAPVMRALQDSGIEYWFLHTGQHRETFDDLRRDFGVKPPDADAVSSSDDAKSLFRFGHWSLQAASALAFRARHLLPVRAGFVLVHGDTASTIWGALLGKATGNAVVHVESGLRSFRLWNPFPEELFRLATFRLTNVYACPDARAVSNLQGHRGERIDLGGNTLYDAFGMALAAGTAPGTPVPTSRFGVISVHRFETLYRRPRLEAVVDGVIAAARLCPLLVVGPPPLVHRLKRAGLLEQLETAPGVRVIPRMSYFPFITLLRRSAFVVTDGGSNQEELAYLGKPTLILREATERSEGLGANAVIQPVDARSIVSFAQESQLMATAPLRYEHSPSLRLVTWLQERMQREDRA